MPERSPPGDPKPSPQVLIGFDYGLRRIGVAVGSVTSGSGTPLVTLDNGPQGPDWRRIDALLREWRPDALVVGLPRHADDTVHPLADAINDFCAALAGRSGLPVHTVDERLSSHEASERLRGQHRGGGRSQRDKKAIDRMAAAVLLETWISEHSNRPMP
ncbi:MAG: Holliday junction resolvase RuvX [Chromatiales bacterium]|jgi:putative Holliday junction resolvase|nr:Holliday junction resolvase RuvX [Chromatiales bacterium]MDX9767434.1 Holliday junction resolvase RuvX [Ectothiorhodospiraceae bacterium]